MTDLEGTPPVAPPVTPPLAQDIEDAAEKLVEVEVAHVAANTHTSVSLLHADAKIVELERDTGAGGIVHHLEQIVDVRR